MKRRDVAGTPFESHMTYAIRTFWIGLVGAIIGVALSLVYIGFLILLALAVWMLYRMIRGLVCALDGRAISNPLSYL